MRVLISGAGIAGLATALCLSRHGHMPLVVEKAPQSRGSGYMIDFFGPGYDAAEALGLLPALEVIHYPIDRLAFVDPRGREKFSSQYRKLRRLFDDRHFNFLRGDLERLLFERVGSSAEVRFGTSVVSIEQGDSEVRVVLTDGTTECFDLVVGADGLHSRVRQLVFGDDRRFFKFLGCNTAAFMIEDGESPTPEDAFLTMTVPSRQVAVYPVRGNCLATFFLYRSEELADYSIAVARDELAGAFASMDWVVPYLLERSRRSTDIYFDAVAQIEMPKWTAGRVTLVGDAAWCLSLLAGQGASMAVFGAQVIAEELAEPNGGIESALGRYEERLRPMVTERQAGGRNMAAWFIPDGRLRLAIRDLMMRTATWPVMSSLFRRSLLLGGKA